MTQTTLSFQNQTVVITGGASGIGLATAQRLSAQGARTILVGRDAGKGQAAARSVPNAVFLQADLSVPDDVSTLAQQLACDFPGLRYLVNNAGVFTPKPFVDHTAEDFDRYLGIVRGSFFLTQSVVRALVAGGRGGAIVNVGSMAHASAVDATGNAPGDDRSGTWVRVAVPHAGPNWGAVLVPRIGTEVVVEFIEGDIDRPLILGQLYNGQDLPPFSAGEDSGVNHPGVISGMHTQSLDGSGFNQWVIDDATGQLRMRLLTSYTAAEVGLGHLIQQGQGAQRGSWRGSGFEAGTQGWASIRAGQGLLLSTTTRAASYGSAQSTQMDAAEALAQLKAMRDLGQRLSEVAKAGTAHGLTSHDTGKSVEKFLQSIDPSKQGKHPGPVNGQEAKKANGRTLTDPVEAFAMPLVLMDTPSTSAFASEASITSFSGQDLSIGVQGDVQHTAVHTYAAVSGQTTSLYTNDGGIQVKAANGPVSLRAHADELHILADQDVTIVSVDDEIRIQASTTIELIAGQSSVVLDGGDITFTCPGNFTAKTSTHGWK